MSKQASENKMNVVIDFHFDFLLLLLFYQGDQGDEGEIGEPGPPGLNVGQLCENVLTLSTNLAEYCLIFLFRGTLEN